MLRAQLTLLIYFKEFFMNKNGVRIFLANSYLHQGVDIAVGHPILQTSKAGPVVAAEVKLVSPSESSLAPHMHMLHLVPTGEPH